MINKIYIRNFLSIKDAEVNLGKVNLIIGPNNSGKSNFLKAFVSLKNRITNLSFKEYQKISNNHSKKNNIAIQIHGNNKELIYQEVFFEYKYDDNYCNYINLVAKTDFNSFFANNQNRLDENFLNENIDSLFFEYSLKGNINQENYSSYKYNKGTKHLLNKKIQDVIIYNVDVNSIKGFLKLNASDLRVSSNGTNIVSFLDNMRDTNPEIIKKIEESLQKTISNFKELRFKKDSNNPNMKMLGLSDTNNNIFWSDELSEGTLYFLAILAIIHQPNPPKLLLLEEPEKNVHPKRIHEIIDYLFQLSEDKDIQIIMTTHSPIVVDEFKDIPENVHLFDFIDNQTIISNGADVIEKQNKERKEKNYSLLDLSNSTLGEQWLMGFLGGVPTE